MIGFDVENRLSQVEGTGGGYSGTATYVYDGDGDRIKKTGGGNTVVYPNKYYEKNVTSGVVTSHYYLGGQQIAIKKGSTLEYLHQDSLNSSSVSTDDDGAQVSKTVFMPFGATRSSTGTLGTDQLYTGQRLDGTGLYFYNARYYDASIGRFISPDTVVEDFSNPQTLNRYSYVYNNPLTYNDPSGHGIGSWLKNAAKSVAKVITAEAAVASLVATKLVDPVLDLVQPIDNAFTFAPDWVLNHTAVPVLNFAGAGIDNIDISVTRGRVGVGLDDAGWASNILDAVPGSPLGIALPVGLGSVVIINEDAAARDKFGGLLATENHEDAHVIQQRLLGTSFVWDYFLEQWAYTYEHQPLENQARDMEDE